MPEAKVAVAHGQMAAGQLEDVMTAFYDGKYDILLSTTIVESGLDIPTANTLIVHRADMFGLAQLYQLRGRVGRSKTRAYALFTVPAEPHADRAGGAAAEGAAVARHARRRLPARLATISTSAAPATCSATSSPATSRKSATSFTSRCWRRRWRSSRPASRSRPRSSGRRTITIGAPVMIPESYVARPARCGSASTGACRRSRPTPRSTLSAPSSIDRFGPLPAEVGQLLKIMAIKVAVPPRQRREGRGAGRRASSSPSATIPSPIRQGLVAYVAEQGSFAKVRPDMKIVFIRDVEEPDERIKATAAILRNLARIAEKKAA